MLTGAAPTNFYVGVKGPKTTIGLAGENPTRISHQPLTRVMIMHLSSEVKALFGSGLPWNWADHFELGMGSTRVPFKPVCEALAELTPESTAEIIHQASGRSLNISTLRDLAAEIVVPRRYHSSCEPTNFTYAPIGCAGKAGIAGNTSDIRVWLGEVPDSKGQLGLFFGLGHDKLNKLGSANLVLVRLNAFITERMPTIN